jgi:tetratricopeptide (TPR) repeat protein
VKRTSIGVSCRTPASAVLIYDRFEHIFWIDASSKSTIEQSYKDMAAQYCTNSPDTEISVECALQWLGALAQEWLILFDNVDDPMIFFGLLPPKNTGNIIYASRNANMRLSLPPEAYHEVAEMDRKEAISLLTKAARQYDVSKELETLATPIVEDLGCLALAIDQAGAYIATGLCRFGDYRQIFYNHRKKLMENSFYQGASKYDRAVYTTFDLSYTAIHSQTQDKSGNSQLSQAAKSAIQILNIFAFFHGENIMEEMFKRAAETSTSQDPGHEIAEGELQGKTELRQHLLQLSEDGCWDSFMFRQGISKLLSFSLIRLDDSGEYYSMHPLVHFWAQDRLSDPDRQGYIRAAKAVISQSVPWKFEEQDYAFRRKLLPHVKACKEHDVSNGTAEAASYALVLYEAGQWKEAEELEVQVMETRKRLLGAEHPDTLTSMTNLALTYSNQGRWKEAEELEVQVVETRKRVLGAERLDTLTSIANLASTYRNQGRWKEAEELFIQVIKTRLRMSGAEHPDTLTSMANLALTYQYQGRWKEAEELDVQVMETRKRVLGAEHPDTLTSIANLASTYRNQGRWKEAEELDIQVVETSLRVLGAEHPSTLTSMANLASTFWNQGRWKKAEELFTQVMETRKRVLGAEHPDTLASMANLASTYRNQGRWKEAEELDVQVMETSLRVLGAEHPSTLTSIANLASTYRNQGRWKKAEELDIQVVETSLTVLGAEHPSTLTSIANLASTYRNQGRWKEAEELDIQMMETKKRVLGAEHPDTLISMANLASTYRNQGRWKEAEELQRQELEICSRVLGRDHPDTLISISNLALILKCQERNNEAIELMTECVRLRERVLGVEHPHTKSSLSTLNGWERERSH